MNSASTGATTAELSLHLAGGTVRDAQRLGRRVGPDALWLTAPHHAWRRAGLAEALIERLSPLADGAAAAREQERCGQLGVRLVNWRQPGYPASLLDLYRPPILLCVRGAWPPPTPAIAMVGARASTAYGRGAAERLAMAAARAGVAVVSGLARGIDRWALEGTLAQRGRTIAVLGCGIDRSYPRENRPLQQRIAEHGTLISEFPLGYPPDRWTFPRRNRIIAALSQAVLVVEAGRRSGALITANHALELGREVWAVPGPIDSSASEGTNRLILDGAAPILDEQGLIQQLGLDRLPGMGSGAGPPDPILEALGERSLDADELAGIARLPVARLRARLMALELEGRVRHLPGDRWSRRRDGR